MKRKKVFKKYDETRQERAVRRTFRRLPNRGPLDAETGEGFCRDASTTKQTLQSVHGARFSLNHLPVPAMDEHGRIV